eukprot:s599_g1.t1
MTDCLVARLRMAALVDEASKSPLPPTEALKKLLPDLKLFCKEGPGLGRGRFPARWLPAFLAGPGGVVPVLNDDSAKAAMLTPAQSLQLLGVLDHPRSHFPSAARLQAKDARVIAALGVLRLSDPAVSLQTRISGEAKLVPGSSLRIGLVLKLLWRSAGKEFSTSQVEVSLRKCDAIGRELSLHSDKASRMEAFAIWGEADPEDQSRYDLLVAGDPDDYVAEVEELFESRFEMVFRACETRPAKVLRLLRHLESERDFNKFLARDFAGVLEQEELERRKSEAKAKVAEQQAARAADTARAEAAARQAATDVEAAKRAKAEASQKAEAEEAAAKAAEQARQAELAEFLEAAKAAKARREAKAAEAKAGTETKAPSFVPATLPTGPSTTAAPTATAACPVPGAPATAASEVAAAAPAKPKGMVVAARFPAKPAAGAVSPEAAPASDTKEAVLPAARLAPAVTLQPPSDKQAPATLPPVVAKNGGIHPLPNVVKAPAASAAGGVVPPRFVAASKEAEEEPQAKRQKLESQETTVAATSGCSGDVGQVASQPDADPTTKLHQELEKLRRENAALRSKASTFSVPPVAGEKPKAEGETAESTVVTKGQIKRMKLEAKEVLYRPIQEGFGFKMLQKFGWKEGEGLGKDEKGLATPLWADPREGRSGLFSAQMGESRPPRPCDEEEDWMNPKPLAANPLRFAP